MVTLIDKLRLRPVAAPRSRGTIENKPYVRDRPAALSVIPAEPPPPVVREFSAEPFVVTPVVTNLIPGHLVENDQSFVLATGDTTPRKLADYLALIPERRSDYEINILDLGASNAGVDCTTILQAALATGNNVYMPKGVYRISGQITVGVSPTSTTSQRLRGDGLGTVIVIEPNFDPAATSVILLQGVENGGPVLQDFYLSFQQPTGANDRAQFVVLGTPGAGTGLLGTKYPPAILFGTGGNNRFKIQRLRIANCWQGIFQAAGTNTGGFWLEDIEISPIECGLQVGSNIDMSHIKGWHHWFFGQTAANNTIMRDGQCYCMRLGVTAATQSLNIQDLSDFTGRISIDNAGSMVQIANLTLDSDNAGVEVINSLWVHVVNAYSTCTSTGPSSGKATFTVQAGWLSVVNHNGYGGLQGLINIAAGRLTYVGGRLQGTLVDVSIARQSGGILRIADSEIFCPVTSAWTTNPVISSTGGGALVFNNNYFSPASAGDVGGVVIATDAAQQIVTDNYFNGWGFTPPGALGNYQTASSFYAKAVSAGSFTAGDVTTTTGVNLTFNSTAQRSINIYETSIIRWALGATTVAASSDFFLLRYNASGVQQPTPLTVRASNGTIFTNQNAFIASYTVAPESLPAAYSWRGIGLVGVDGLAPCFEVFQNATSSSGIIRFARSRGTAASPTAVTNGDVLGDIIFGGYDGTAWQARTGIIRGGASINWANGSAYDTFLQFYGSAGTTLTQFMQLSTQGLAVNKITATATAPGAGFARLAFIAGTTGGTAKLVAYAGTSTTPSTILDNIGAGF